jgi:hypothetical protein
MEYEEATHLYRRSLAQADQLFHLPPPLPSAALSHCDDDTWYLRGDDGRLIARVSRLGVRLAAPTQ